MGIIGDKGTLETRISTIDILQWKLGTDQKEPIVHAVEAKEGVGWGGHLGFSEIHEAFVDAVLEGKPILTSVEDCLDGTRMTVAAEDSIREKRIIEL